MVIGIIISMAIAVLIIAKLWPTITSSISELDNTTPAYGNLTAITNTIPQQTNSVFALIFVAVIIIVIVGIYAYWKKAAR